MKFRSLFPIITLTTFIATLVGPLGLTGGQHVEASTIPVALPKNIQGIPGVSEQWWTTIQEEVRPSANILAVDPLSTTPDWTDEETQASAYFGASVGTAGDVNGDGYDDVIVGSPGYDINYYGSEEGRVYVYYGSESGLSTIPDWTGELDNAYTAEFGTSVGTAGDVNKDGYSDVIIGARRYTNGEQYEGGAFVYYGSATGLSATPDWSAEGDEELAWFGISVSTAGDVNDDGYSDVVIGMDNWVSGCAGKAFVYHGSETGLSDTPNWSLVYTPTEACFGASVGTAGDVNNDGYDDVIIGAPYYSNEQTEEGAAFVFHGSSTGLSPTPNWMVESNQTEAYYGNSVGTAGDITNDGYDDVLVGAPYFTNVESLEGRAFVYYGSGSGLSTSPNWTAEINQEFAYFGSAVASAGDVNRDGYSDVLIGAPHYSNGNNSEGGAFLYLGSDLGLSPTPDWTTESDHSFAYYGNSLGTAGDVNGNGVQDIIVGAYGYETENDFAGKAYVYHDTIGYLVFLPVVMR